MRKYVYTVRVSGRTKADRPFHGIMRIYEHFQDAIEFAAKKCNFPYEYVKDQWADGSVDVMDTKKGVMYTVEEHILE